MKNILTGLYKLNNHRIRRIIRTFVPRMDGGEYNSTTLREIFETHHNVKIGPYTHGGCFVPFQFDKHTTIGNYCSIALTARAMNRNHPLNAFSTHALFFNPKLGFSTEDSVPYNALEIGHDVWIGHNAIIMPQVSKISTGAVIAAGAVVNKDIPPYAVVIGNPARIVRYRFDEQTIEKLLESRWWENPPEKLKENFRHLFEIISSS